MCGGSHRASTPCPCFASKPLLKEKQSSAGLTCWLTISFTRSINLDKSMIEMNISVAAVRVCIGLRLACARHPVDRCVARAMTKHYIMVKNADAGLHNFFPPCAYWRRALVCPPGWHGLCDSHSLSDCWAVDGSAC